MAAAKKINFNENFISTWEIEESLWNVKIEVFKSELFKE